MAEEEEVKGCREEENVGLQVVDGEIPLCDTGQSLHKQEIGGSSSFGEFICEI